MKSVQVKKLICIHIIAANLFLLCNLNSFDTPLYDNQVYISEQNRYDPLSQSEYVLPGKMYYDQLIEHVVQKHCIIYYDMPFNFYSKRKLKDLRGILLEVKNYE